MLIRIDVGSAEPLYGQIAGQIRRAVARGDLRDGDRLPPAKELARAVGVNLHTVLRAYGDLRDAGLLELRPRRGAVVRGSGLVEAGLVEQVRHLLGAARRLGFTESEIVELVRREL
jgi:DNA-binding transcriptional regulator YhcF (GntR family)